MSIILKSTLQIGPIFLQAITAWASGDLANTQILCLQCLEGLRYNPSFPHLAACLYFLAFCVREDNKAEYADDVIDCLQNKCDTKALQLNLPWSMLESFNGTSKSFFELASQSDQLPKWEDDVDGDVNGDGEVNGDEDYFVASPAWYHHSSNHLTSGNYESLALFCLEMGLRELGVAFAIRAHQESKRRESPDLCDIDCDAFPSSPPRLPSLSLPLLRHLNFLLSLQPDEECAFSHSLEVTFAPTVESSPLHEQPSEHQFEEAAVRRRARGSILKSPSALFNHTCDKFDQIAHPEGAGDHDAPRIEKRVRFSLSASHPPPDVEAEFGGRSNSQRIQDMARRRVYLNSAPDAEGSDSTDDSGGGAFDRLVDVFWPGGEQARSSHRLRCRGRRRCHCHHFGRCLIDVTAFLTCLLALLIFSLLFLSLVVCIPLAWFTISPAEPLTDAVSSGGSALVGTCVRLLNAFGLHALLAM